MEIKKEDTCKKYNKTSESIYIPSESSLRANPDIQKYIQFALIQKIDGELYSKTGEYNKIELMFMKLLNPLSDNPNSNNFIKFITGNIDLPALLQEKQIILEPTGVETPKSMGVPAVGGGGVLVNFDFTYPKIDHWHSYRDKYVTAPHIAIFKICG